MAHTNVVINFHSQFELYMLNPEKVWDRLKKLPTEDFEIEIQPTRPIPHYYSGNVFVTVKKHTPENLHKLADILEEIQREEKELEEKIRNTNIT